MEKILNLLSGWITNTGNILVSHGMGWLSTLLSAGLKVVIAVVIMFISFKLINFIGKRITKRFEVKKFDKTFGKTIVYVGKIAAKCVVVVCLVGFVGIDTSAITALITSAGVCIGLAVNGAVSNFAGGILILVTRPFKVDDFIEAQGVSGVVSDIHMTATKIVTGDNKVIYVPNGELANGNIINYSERDTRRVDMEFSISYDADSEKAIHIIREILLSNGLVMKDKDIFVRVTDHGDSALIIKARAWVSSKDYWTVYYDTLEEVKSEFDRNGIEIPYNQLEIRIRKEEK